MFVAIISIREAVAKRPCGETSVWLYVHLVKRPCVETFVWRNVRVAKRPCSETSVWLNVRVAKRPVANRPWRTSYDETSVHRNIEHSGKKQTICEISTQFTFGGKYQFLREK